MAGTLEGLALTKAHDTAQAVNTAQALQAATLTFEGLLDLDDVAGTFDAYADAQTAVVNAYRGRSADMAHSYYGALRSTEGVTAPLPNLPLPAGLNAAQANTSLLVTGPVAYKKALSTGKTPGDAKVIALNGTLGAVGRHVQNGGRDAIQGAVSADPAARGWSRVSGGNPCSFCAMLISRGPVYREETASFRTHDHCRCRAVPFFLGSGWTAQAAEFRRIWDESTKGAVGPKAQRRAFSRAYAERFPRTSPLQTRMLAAAEDASFTAARASKAAAEAAEAEARALAEAVEKAEAEAYALKKKWEGKPAPQAPTAPPAPPSQGDKMLRTWEQRVKDRFEAFTGGSKTLEQSLNWPKVRKVVDEKDDAALRFLLEEKYLDQDLFDYAREAFAKGTVFDPADEEAYKKALRSFRNRSTRHKRYLEEWRMVNGVSKSPLKGMTGALEFTTEADALDWAEKAWASVRYAPEERSALSQYTGNDYRPWNDALREAKGGDVDPRWKDLTERADRAMAKTAFPEDAIVHRGTNWNEFEFPDGNRATFIPPPDPTDLVGTVQTQHGYWSTSVGTRAAFSGNVRMEIRVPQGHRGSYVANFSRFKSEREMLLERGTNFYVHDVYRDARGWVMEAEVIPAGVDPKAVSAVPSPKPR